MARQGGRGFVVADEFRPERPVTGYPQVCILGVALALPCEDPFLPGERLFFGRYRHRPFGLREGEKGPAFLVDDAPHALPTGNPLHEAKRALRERIVALSQEQYNAMLLGVYQLLQAKQNETNTYREYIEAVCRKPCSTSLARTIPSCAERIRQLTNGAAEIIIDDRALDARAIEMLAAILIGQDDGKPLARPPARKHPGSPPSRQEPPARRTRRSTPSWTRRS